MTARRVRVAVALVCVAGIAGMIAGSIADNNAVAMTFGLLTAVAALCLIVASAVTAPGPVDPDLAGADVEARIARLVEQGGDEKALRDLVRAALKLSRAASTATPGRTSGDAPNR
jgi:hypothetical protein